MKFLDRKNGLAFALAGLISTSASANQYEIDSVTITQLFSSTFDGLVMEVAVEDDGTFFGNVPNIDNPIFGTNRSIQIDQVEGSEGTGFIGFDGTELDYLNITLPDVNLTIITSATNTLYTETSGASISIYPKLILGQAGVDGGDDANFDIGGPLSENSTVQVVDFSPFNNLAAGEPGVVTSCVNVDNFCGVLPALSLDGFRYTLEGTPTADGGDTYTLRVQTANFSYYEVEFTTASISSSKNVPAMGTFGLIALFGGLIAVAARLRRRVS
jgi:hypothetical protein